jgi:beta-glucosidase
MLYTARTTAALARLVVFPLILLQSPRFAAAQATGNEARIKDLLSRLTLQEEIRMLSGSGMMATTGVERLQIPAFRMTDGPMGAHIPPPSTAYAAGIGLAASWDRELARQIGVQLGRDARSRGAAFLLGPGVNIYRSPLNGRNFEYFGEDPYLADETAVAYINGVQSQNVSATIKHFAANNSEYFRFTSDSQVSERALREIYLPAFEAAVKKAHVGAIMDSYNLVNGHYATENYHLNVEIAKQEWRFDGVMMSDWTATHDGVAAANGGLDLEMPFGWYMNELSLVGAVKQGKVKAPVIEDKVRRLLGVAYRFGWMEKDPLDQTIPRYNLQGREAALQGAREGIVLLKNQANLLPLDLAHIKTIAVIGPNAFPAVPTAGGSGQVPTFSSVSILTGFSDHLAGKVNVLYDRGIPNLAVLAVRSGFSQAPDKFTPGLTVETFDNPAFHGKPIATRREMTANTGSNALDNPEMADLINNITSDQLQAFMNQGPTKKFERWTGYYFSKSNNNYRVFVEDQGKYRLSIDGRTVIDHVEIPKSALAQTVVALMPGPHKVVLETLSAPQFGAERIKIGIAQEGTFVNQSAIDMARKADAVIVAVGFNQDIETEGADREFQLPPGQDELIEAIAAANRNTIVTITSGGSVDVARWIDKVGALLQNWYPGQEGGTAMAEILSGDVNPSGRLPISWERSLDDNPSMLSYYPNPGTLKIPYKDDVFVGYRGYEHNRVRPRFHFGFGLGYTTFKYANLQIRPTGGPGAYEVSFDVTNSGTRAGVEVPQVYVGEDHPPVPRPPQELKGFTRVALQPGETRRVSIPLDGRSFTWYDEKARAWHADAGSFTIHASRSSADPQLEGKVTLPQAIVLPVN